MRTMLRTQENTRNAEDVTQEVENLKPVSALHVLLNLGNIFTLLYLYLHVAALALCLSYEKLSS